MFRSRLVAGAVVAALFWPAAAHAGERVVLYAFETVKLPKTIEFAGLGLHKVVSEHLAGAGYEVVEPVLGLKDMMVALACPKMNTACAKAIAKNLEVDAVAVGRLEALKKGPIRIRLRLWRVTEDAPRLVDEKVPPKVDALTESFGPLAGKLVEGIAPVADPEPGEDLPDMGTDDGTDAGDASADLMDAPTDAGTAVLPAAPAKKSATFNTIAIVGAAVASVGGAAIIAGLGTGYFTLTLRRDLMDSNYATIEDFDAMAPTRRRGRTLAAASIVLFSVGGGLMAAGLVTAFTAKGARVKAEKKESGITWFINPLAPEVGVRVRFGGKAP